jgi:eukaryotic-like serine/threonine-protein kinase
MKAPSFMKAPSSAETLVPSETTRQTPVTGLPAELLEQSARRLRIMALLYAFVFFMSDPLLAILFSGDRARFLATPIRWAPSTISIATALIVAGLSWKGRIPVQTVLTMGLVFEVIGSFGIAAAQFLDASQYGADTTVGLSWVAVWMSSFTVIIPSPPRRALAAAFASAASVPLTVGFVMAMNLTPVRLSPLRFFFVFVLPYLLVVLMAYVGARVVYKLGTELNRARELGSYQLVERLGEGGMGEVWRAKHRFLARPAAIKLMRPEMLGGSSVERKTLSMRFEREAQATASMRSPHTIELYDFGVADDGSFYYVMEFLDGFDLQALIDQFGPIPPERAVHLLTQVCHSLAEAHAEGLIHRDIKPANVYVCRHGREVDFVKVLDFGLVKSQNETFGSDISLSRDHFVGGTPSFMPPEQVLGNGPLDGRSDIYSVGCLTYWLVTGRLVFTGRTPMEIMFQHTQAKPTPPSKRTELQLSQAFDELVMACLEKSPDNRPPTAEVLSERLATVETANAWTPERARNWWDLHRPKKQEVASVIQRHASGYTSQS